MTTLTLVMSLRKECILMRLVRKEDITNPLKNPSGEEIYEMIGGLPEI